MFEEQFTDFGWSSYFHTEAAVGITQESNDKRYKYPAEVK
jgi:hypothetical protein